jgi:hypothetical protein
MAAVGDLACFVITGCSGGIALLSQLALEIYQPAHISRHHHHDVLLELLDLGFSSCITSRIPVAILDQNTGSNRIIWAPTQVNRFREIRNQTVLGHKKFRTPTQVRILQNHGY